MLEALRGRSLRNGPEIDREGLPNGIESLNRSERETLGKLKKVELLVDALYQIQKQTPIYPEGITKEALLEIGKKDPAILSPTTVVERKNGVLIAVPYHERYKRESQKAATTSREAAKVIDDPETRKTLKALSTAFAQGKWSEFEIAWLTQSWQPTIDVFAGPFEPHMDHLLGRKHVFEIVFGHIDRFETEQVRRIVELAIAVSGRDRESLPRIQVRVDNIAGVGGLLQGLGANAFTMPNDPEVGKKYGYKIVFFKKNIEETFSNHIWPVTQAVFEESVAKKFDYSALFEASQIWLALHEASHPLVQQTSKRDRFLDHFAAADELHCDVSAINLANELKERSLIPPQLFEKILMIHIANKFVDYARYELFDVEEKEAYARGSIAELNFLLEQAGFKADEHNQLGFERENEIVESSKDLLGYLDILAKSGTYQDIKRIFHRYGSNSNLRRFDTLLHQALTGAGEEVQYSI